MPLSLINNISSSNAIRRLSSVSGDLSRTQEQLSSGLRIARPSDDAAGLAISRGLATDAKVYSQSLRNVNDAIGLLNTAEGAVTQLSNIVTRQRELAEQAANGVYSGRQRAALNAEANALVNEYNRIVRSSTFNNVNIIDGVNDSFNTQQGYGIAEQTLIDVAQSLGVAAGTGGYTNSSSIDVSGTPVSAVGDINGDGYSDAVTLDSTSGSGFITTGSASGSYSTSATITFGTEASSAALADLDNDGDLDLVVTSSDDDLVYILRGNGDGTFEARQGYAMPGAALDPMDVQIRDLNGDGNLDLVTALQGADGRIGVYLGNGGGTFKAGVSYVVGTANLDIASLTLGDFNGDGIGDVAAVASNVTTYSYVLLGNDDGSFGAATTYSLGGSDIAQGDFNGDGLVDLVSVRVNYVIVKLGNGDGSFRAPMTTLVAGSTMTSVVVADANGDGLVDVAVADNAQSRLTVFRSNGDGSFLVPISTSGTSAARLSAGDFNGDGITDFLVDRSTTSRIHVSTGIADTSGRRNNFQYRLDLLTINSARDALTNLTTYQNRINLELGKIGALQSRLSSAVNNLENRRVNYRDAQSQIEDVDVAEASARLVSQKILQQSAAAVLAQANQQPKLALTLLGTSTGVSDQ